MKIAIFGAGKAGKHLYNEIKKKSRDIEVEAFLDNKQEGSIDRIDIQKPDLYLKNSSNCLDAVFMAAGAQKTNLIMMNTLLGFGIKNIYMLHDIAGKCNLPVFDENGQILSQRLRKIRFNDEKPSMPYIEVPITDQCNLNCKGCLFACNHTDQLEHVPASQVISDLKRMSELFCDIPWIRILGGEPLMHPDLLEILNSARCIFPDSEIDLCTNGLMIPKVNDEFCDQLKESRISIHVSGYKPTYGILAQIDEKLRNSGLNYTILKREKFLKYYTEESGHDIEKNFVNCIASGCRELYRGRLMRCSGVIAFEKMNKQFHTNYKIIPGSDWYDIYDNNPDVWQMIKELNHGAPSCGYCDTVNMEEFDWGYGGVKSSLKDYMIVNKQ